LIRIFGEKSRAMARREPIAMTIGEFRDSLAGQTAPFGVSKVLQALWHEARGDWERAHEIVQSVKDKSGARVHAYLHRKEGDLDNANYWYDRSGTKMPKTSLEKEWEALVTELLRET
jgi:hypothetical protein